MVGGGGGGELQGMGVLVHTQMPRYPLVLI